jgi:protein-S-isoprenylcysteine O-methyltransferase Ste14
VANIAVDQPPSVPVGLALDIVERVSLMTLFTRMLVSNIAVIQQPGHWFNVLLLVSEGLAVLLLLVRRRSTDISPNFADWLFAFFATLGPLLVTAWGGKPLVPPLVGGVWLCMGIALQLSAKVILGRSFGIVPANRGVKVEGPYRLVRHPMYLGYVMVHIGFLMLAPNLWNFAVYAVSFSVQVARILAEERLLSQDPAYAVFMTRTRWRLVPGVF